VSARHRTMANLWMPAPMEAAWSLSGQATACAVAGTPSLSRRRSIPFMRRALQVYPDPAGLGARIPSDLLQSL
jgi:hypothetical protein